MIEINFPTLKKYFKNYNNMSLLIILLDNCQKHVYRNIPNQSEAVKIQIMDKENFDTFERSLKFRKWYSSPFWLKTLNSKEEILRNSVYELIKKEFNELIIN